MDKIDKFFKGLYASGIDFPNWEHSERVIGDQVFYEFTFSYKIAGRTYKFVDETAIDREDHPVDIGEVCRNHFESKKRIYDKNTNA